MTECKVGINGFGRMGRLLTRALAHHPGVRVVHVNELHGGPDTAAHLLEFDSVHGRWDRPVDVAGDGLVIDGRPVGFTDHDTPGAVPWSDAGVSVVAECSGAFCTIDQIAPYFDGGVDRVVVAAPVTDERAANIVVGCNDDHYRPDEHRVVTAASCTTNCIAPVIKVLHRTFGIERGMITTLHDVSNTQTLADAPHKDLRRARSALTSLIPTTTGSATAITVIYPELAGKLDGVAVRVPLLNASLSDIVVQVARPTTVEEVNAALRAAADGELKGILGFEDRPLVSVDYVDDPRSSIVDGPSTMVTDGTLIKVLAWYDNEWGYVQRMAELLVRVAGDGPVAG
ncbi:MAG: ArsJ-associated glyceraldehyde-3-phosphate dehydrogenase [Actinomycetota bacterium]